MALLLELLWKMLATFLASFKKSWWIDTNLWKDLVLTTGKIFRKNMTAQQSYCLLTRLGNYLLKLKVKMKSQKLIKNTKTKLELLLKVLLVLVVQLVYSLFVRLKDHHQMLSLCKFAKIWATSWLRVHCQQQSLKCYLKITKAKKLKVILKVELDWKFTQVMLSMLKDSTLLLIGLTVTLKRKVGLRNFMKTHHLSMT